MMAPWLLSSILLAGPAQSDDAIRAAVTRLLPANTATIDIRPSPIAGVSEVVAGIQVFYVTSGGRYLLGGPLYSLDDNSNLSEQRLNVVRRDVMARSTLSNAIVYAAEEPRHRVTVVTNVDCGYCRAMHTQLKDYLNLGIEFEYIMVPMGGAGSPGFKKTAALLCAGDPAAAITQAMTGGPVPDAITCDHQLERHMALAGDLGAGTTPNLILSDGRLIRGLLPPEELLRVLGSNP